MIENGYGLQKHQQQQQQQQDRKRNKRKRGVIETAETQTDGSTQQHTQKRVKGRHHPGGRNKFDEKKTRNGSDERTHGKDNAINSVDGNKGNDYYVNGDGTDDLDGEDEDDAEIMSDFEFAVDDMVNGNVSDDFDGWGIGVGAGSVVNRGIGTGDKKGVDLDEIIARRRGNKKGYGRGDDDDVESEAR